MDRPYPAPAIVIARHPVHSIFAAFPTACFTLALVNDIAYWRSSNLVWKHFAEWLLFFGIVGGVLALIAGLLDVVLRRRPSLYGPVWPYPLAMIAALVLATINSLVHSGDGWPAVVPWGLVLSALTVLAVLAAEWAAGTIAFRTHPERMP